MKLHQILLIAMLISGVILLFLGKNLFAIFFILAFIFTLVSFKVVDKTEIKQRYKVYICAFLFLHLLGALYFYGNFKYYDKILHFIVPFFITVMVYDYISKFKLTFPRTMILLIVLGLLVSFELFEYLCYTFFDLRTLGVYNVQGISLLSLIDDTMWDLLIGGLSSLLFLIIKK